MFTNESEKFTGCLRPKSYSSKGMKKKWIFILIAVLVIAVSIPTYVFAAEAGANPALATVEGESQVFDTYSNVGLYPEALAADSWKITLPEETRGYKPATSRMYTNEKYIINEFTFTAQFDSCKGSTSDWDGFAVFAASDTDSYNGYEFGVRNSLRTAKVEGYIQFPDIKNGKKAAQKNVDLMVNDGLTHDYRVIIRGSTVVFFVDDVVKGILDIDIQFEGKEYAIIALGHRSTDGWAYSNEFMTVGNFGWQNLNTALVEEVNLKTAKAS